MKKIKKFFTKEFIVLPPYNLGDFIIQQIEEYTHTTTIVFSILT